jgi:opacity protein-like surface antigen
MAVSRTVSSNVDRTIFHSTGTPIPPPTLVPLTQFNLTASDASSNVYTVGWTAGLGAEYMLWGSVFVRGEWEYIKFVQVDGTAVSQNSVTAAIGYKF